jgi:catechol 2,3-dioxygenase-like lactoylglutathione lyase family enzyme
MPHALKSLTPNLIVSNVERSITFYRDTLGFDVETTVPEITPYVFAIVTSGGVRIFFNAPEAAVTEYPVLGSRPLGGTLTLFIEVTGIRELYGRLLPIVKVVMPIEVKWYGQTEFAFEDPDGYVITIAERE